MKKITNAAGVSEVHVQVVNQSDDPIQFRFAPAEITFGGGKPVHEKRCVEDFPAEPITIHRGEMITVSCRFVVNEIGPYSGRNPISVGPVLIEVAADGNWTFTKA